MSHVCKVELQIKDLAALEAACRAVGLELVRGQKTYRWYSDLNPGANRAYRRSETDGHCDHAIRIPGADGEEHEIGVARTASGAYELRWDPMGRIVEMVGGSDARKLRQEYSSAVATKWYKQHGYRVSRSVKADGRIVLNASK